MARVLPFVLFVALIAATKALGDRPMGGMDARWLYPVRAVVAGALLIAFRRSYDELAGPFRASGRDLVLALGCGLAVFLLWIRLDVGWLVQATGTGYDPTDGKGGILWRFALPRLAGAAIVVPVMEELFWRSFVMRWIDRQAFLEVAPASVSLRALAISSVIFGLEHELWAAGIVAGLVYGWLYKRSGNLWVPIVAHAITNLVLGMWVLRSGQWRFW